MKKKILSLVMAGLIGATPVSSLAANANLHIQVGKTISIISQQNHGPKDKKDDKRGHDRREKERRERERREQERREKERKEAERRERERRERERWERERREKVKDDARYVIHRTADVIYVAQRSAGRRHYYKGLAQAVSHQQKARRLYMAGFYQDAIFHSLRARRIAITIIQGNREKWSGSWDTREEWYLRLSPRDNDLDVKLNLIKIGDQEAIRISIDLDL